MCGIIGIYGQNNVASELYDGLLAIQHRGQDAAGIVTYDGKFHLEKGLGLVRDLFLEGLNRFNGRLGLGHVRYPTVGAGNPDDAQPFVVNSPFGIAMVHNGNVTNYSSLKKELFEKNFRQLNSSCDVEVILNVFADELRKQDLRSFSQDTVFKAVAGVFKRVNGSYSVIAVIAGKGLVAFRDPHGIKPVLFGMRNERGLKSYMFCSESVALSLMGYRLLRDVLPGEAIFIDKNLKIHSKRIVKKKHTPCIFEYVYFARPDSMLDKISVYKTRLRLGKALGKAWKRKHPMIKPDVVVPVPDTARAAAMALAQELGVKYREALIKNKYIGRTFIMPSQAERRNSVKRKLNPIPLEIRGKKVLLVDDSIVRGNTSKQIVNMVREAGAKEVYFASTAPLLKFQCVYGIDMSTEKEFVAKHHSIEQVRRLIGADILIYQDKADMVAAAQTGNKEIEEFCTACFDGNYPTGDVTEELLAQIERERLNSKQGLLQEFL